MKKVIKITSLPQAIKRKRVAAYARVSGNKDAMRHSLSAQVSYYNNFIQRHIEWEFARHICRRPRDRYERQPI